MQPARVSFAPQQYTVLRGQVISFCRVDGISSLSGRDLYFNSAFFSLVCDARHVHLSVSFVLCFNS